MNYLKKTIRTRSVASPRQSLEIPNPRGRILSDTAIVPRKNFLTDYGKCGRPPLVDLNKNVSSNCKSEVNVQENIKVKKTSKCKLPESPKISNKYQHSLPVLIKEPAVNNSSIKEPVIKRTSMISKVVASRRSLPSGLKSAVIEDLKSVVIEDYDVNLVEIFLDNDGEYISFKPPDVPDKEPIKNKAVRAFIGGKFTSPIKHEASTATVMCQIISQDRKRTAKLPSSAFDETFCMSEYLKDIVLHQLRNDRQHLLKKDVLEVYKPCLGTRATVINWLMYIQNYLGYPPVVLLTTVRMFDKVLGSTSIPTTMYQLVGLVLMWIVKKFHDQVDILTVKHMVAFCNNTYSPQKFVQMERKLLIFFGFHLTIPDVALYAMYYIRTLNFESDLLLNIAYYILESFTLNIRFSMVAPSVQAAGAVCLAITICQPRVNAWGILKHVVGCCDVKELKAVMREMIEGIVRMQQPSCKYRQAYQNYGTKEKDQASIAVQRLLAA